MSANRSNWDQTQLEHVAPFDGGRDGAIALGRQLDDRGLWNGLVLRLDSGLAPVAGSDWLPVDLKSNRGWIAVAGDRQALLVVTQRDPESTFPIVETVQWLAVSWRGSRIDVEPLGAWDELQSGNAMRGVQVGDGTVWAGTYYPPGTSSLFDHRETCLFLGRATGLEIPEGWVTDISCVDLSEPIVVGDEVYLLVTNRFERMELWSVDRHLNPRKVADLEQLRGRGRQSLGPGRMARCGDELLMVWGHYIDRVGEKRPRTWQGGLHAASYNAATGTLSPITPLAQDPRVVAATIGLHPLVDSAVVTWESRPKRGGGMRAARFSAIDELPVKPVALESNGGDILTVLEPGTLVRSYVVPGQESWFRAFDLPELPLATH